MKKLFALVLALCLSAFCVSALADTRTAYEFDDFILTTDGSVSPSQKAANSILVSYFPASSAGNTFTNINAVWSNAAAISYTGELGETLLSVQKDLLLQQLAAAGMPVAEFEIVGTADAEFWGFPCSYADFRLVCSLYNYSLTMEIRQIVVPFTADNSYIFTITAMTDADPALLAALQTSELPGVDKLTEVLLADIEWRK